MGFQSRTKDKIGGESADGQWKGVPDMERHIGRNGDH